MTVLATPRSLFDVPAPEAPAPVVPPTPEPAPAPRARRRRNATPAPVATAPVAPVEEEAQESTPEAANPEDAPFAHHLTPEAIEQFQNNAIGVRLKWFWVTQQRVVSKDIKAEFANDYDAEEDSFGIFARLWPSDNQYVAALRKCRAAVDDYWKTRTLAFTERGVRVLHQTRLEVFWAGIAPLIANLQTAVENFKANLQSIVAAAQAKHGHLFKRENYPLTEENVVISAVCKVCPIVAPNYLLAFAPTVYNEAQRQFSSEMRTAALTWERELAQQLGELVNHLCHSLTPDAEGNQRIFRDSSVENVRAFFQQFRDLQMANGTQLSEVVRRAENVLRPNVNPQDLRDMAELRSNIRQQLAEVRDTIASDYLVDVTKKRRNIIRPKKEENK